MNFVLQKKFTPEECSSIFGKKAYSRWVDFQFVYKKDILYYYETSPIDQHNQICIWIIDTLLNDDCGEEIREFLYQKYHNDNPGQDLWSLYHTKINLDKVTLCEWMIKTLLHYELKHEIDFSILEESEESKIHVRSSSLDTIHLEQLEKIFQDDHKDGMRMKRRASVILETSKVGMNIIPPN